MSELLPDLFVRPDYDNAGAIVTFTAPQSCTNADWAVLDGESVVSSGTVQTDGGVETSFVVEMGEFKPWNVNTPNLYALRMRLTIAGSEVEDTQDFGMVQMRVTPDNLFVNNKRFFLRGHIRGREAHEHPNLENLPLEEYYAKNIRMAKQYGFNFIRFHSRIPPEECFRMADRLGIFIHIEMRKYYGKYQKERQTMLMGGRLLDADEWTEMVLRLRNHPSLMVYCMGNEIDHPGRNPVCKEFYDLTKKLDPTRFFLDTCSRGEFDRESVDLDVQHMSYYYPFGHSYNMYEDTQNWLIYGSCTGLPLVEQDAEEDYTWKLMRRIPSPRPVLAHEVCHYAGLRDVYALDEKFKRCEGEKPWWIEELKKLIKLKGHEKNYAKLLETSKRFQMLSWKLGIEGARRSSVLSGFHMLQFADTDRYENSNGVVDCFDDAHGVDEKAFLEFNGDTAVLADLPRRTFFEKEAVLIPVMMSHFSAEMSGMADLSFAVESLDGDAVSMKGKLEKIDLDERGLREVAQLRLRWPETARPEALTLRLQLAARDGSYTIENSWNLWLYPNRPQELASLKATIALDNVHPTARYPQIEQSGTLTKPEQLIITHRFSGPVFEHLANGGDVLMLYRVPATRDRKAPAEKEKYYLPATWDRFKAVIWDRGHNCGAFMRASSVFDGFPNDGFLDLQFHGLVDDCDKIILDDFPVEVAPIMEGVDKASRDRFDVYNYHLSELQPAYTMRKFGYMFELKVGKGRLFITGFNFTGINANKPETCAMFESVIRYVTSDAFAPKAEISVEALEKWLLEKGNGPIVKERRMTQFWQLDEEPLESKKYWNESLEYLDEEPAELDIWMQKMEENKRNLGKEEK